MFRLFTVVSPAARSRRACGYPVLLVTVMFRLDKQQLIQATILGGHGSLCSLHQAGRRLIPCSPEMIVQSPLRLWLTSKATCLPDEPSAPFPGTFALPWQVMTFALCLCRLLICCSGQLTTLRRGHSTALMTAHRPPARTMRLRSPRCLHWRPRRLPVVPQWACLSPGSLQQACCLPSSLQRVRRQRSLQWATRQRSLQWATWQRSLQRACRQDQPLPLAMPRCAQLRSLVCCSRSPQLGPQHSVWLLEITPWLPTCRVVQAQYAQEPPSRWPQPAAAVRALQQTVQNS